MKRILLVLIVALTASSINAEVYTELGLGVGVTSYTHDNGNSIEVVMGQIEIGYTAHDASVYLYHISSLTQKDGGITLLGVKQRLSFFE